MTDDRVIPKLEQNPSFDGLKVAQSRFGFEGIDARVRLEDRIPRTRVRSAVQRNLGSPVGRRREAPTNSFKEPNLRHVPHRVTSRKQAEARHETDGGAEAAQLLDPEVLELASLEAPDLAARDADRPAEIILAQADRHPR